MDVKEFLEQPEIKELIAQNDLEAVYDRYYPLDSRKDLSEYLVNLGINPLDYFEKLIPNSAFYACNSLRSLTIPESVTTIGDDAFGFCKNLASITIRNGATMIGKYAFSHCLSLTSIAIPDSVTTIGEYAFLRCEKLPSITIPTSVTTIGEGAFWLCDSLTNIDIPDTIMNIGKHAFYFCHKLTDIQYNGTKEQWKKVRKSPKWRAGSPINIIHCNDGDILLKQQN